MNRSTKEQRSGLAVVPGGGEQVAATALPWRLPPAYCRPGERTEPWRFAITPGIRHFVIEAATTGIDLRLATSVALELAIALEDLAGAGHPTPRTALEEVAERRAIAGPLSATASDYLSSLGRRRPYQPSRVDGEIMVVPLPVRVGERLLRAGGDREPDVELLGLALRCERAALLEARTLAEWAAFAVLRSR